MGTKRVWRTQVTFPVGSVNSDGALQGQGRQTSLRLGHTAQKISKLGWRRRCPRLRRRSGRERHFVCYPSRIGSLGSTSPQGLCVN